MSLREVIAAIDKCLQELDCLNAYYWIFGVSAEQIPSHIALEDRLMKQRDEYHHLQTAIKQKRAFWVGKDATTTLDIYCHALREISSIRRNYDDHFVKVLCSESQLKKIALQVQKQDAVRFSKHEIEKLFNLTKIIPHWHSLPDYTMFNLGGGITLESPELDMFEALCWTYDESVDTHQKIHLYRQKVNSGMFTEEDVIQIRNLVSRHTIMCKQTVMNSFLFIESFLNSQAYLHVTNPHPLKKLTEDEKLYLSEKIRDAEGREKVKFISTQDKLLSWTKLISPRNETFDKGRNPYQEFMKIKKYRDSIVHLTAEKVIDLRSINYDAARQAVLTAIDIVKKFSEFTSVSTSDVQYPWWFKEPGSDGMFHLSRVINLVDWQG